MQPGSPAALAGLCSDSDYIIGADSVLHEVRGISAVIVSMLYSYSTLIVQHMSYRIQPDKHTVCLK